MIIRLSSHLIRTALTVFIVAGCNGLGIEAEPVGPQDNIDIDKFDDSTPFDGVSSDRSTDQVNQTDDNDPNTGNGTSEDIGSENADTSLPESATESISDDSAGDSTDSDTQSSDAGNGTDSDTVRITDTLDTVPDDDSASEVANDTHTDTETDSASNSDTEIGPPTDSEEDSVVTADSEVDTDIPCPGTIVGIETVNETDIPAFTSYGGAQCVLETVSDGPVNSAWRVDTTGLTMPRPYDTQLEFLPAADIQSGDHLVLEYWSRCVSSASANGCRTGVQVEHSETFVNLMEYYDWVDMEWAFHQIPFVASEDYAGGNYQISFRLGYANQVVQLATKRLVNFGAISETPRMDCLANTTNIYSSVEIVSVFPPVAYEGQTYAYVVEVNGFPPPTVSTELIPTWMAFDASSKLFEGTPGAEYIGSAGDFAVSASNDIDSDVQVISVDVQTAPQ